jgi:3-deoxy-7-phosphoheptulonate synthase
MIVVMRPSATQQEIDGVRSSIEEHGLEAFLSVGDERTVIGVVGDVERISHLGTLPGVDQVIRVSSPYKLASLQEPGERTRVRVGPVDIGLGAELVVMAGPCAVESRDQLLETARCVAREGARILRGGAWKPRTSPYSFQGMGVPALKLLAEARGETGLPIISEVVDPHDIEVFDEHVDILQVGARNMQNFALLRAVGQSRHPVLLKRGLSSTIEEWLLAAEYVLSAGNPNVILCERGIRTFETATRNTLDLSAVPVLRSKTHLPIVIDPSHGTGARALVGPMALAGAAVGADGLLIEVHPDPANARSDGDQSLDFDEFGALMDELRRLQFVRSAEERADSAEDRAPLAAGVDELRARIDEADARLATLLQERAGLALEVQRRRSARVHGHDVQRERELLERAATGTSGPLSPVELTMVFDAVLRASRSVQRRHAQSVVLGEDDDAAAVTGSGA